MYEKIWFLETQDLVSKLSSFEAQVLFRFCLLSREIKGPLLRGYKLINNFFKKRSFQQYLFLDILTNSVRVTLTKRGIILGKNRLPILLFTYYSLKIKFAPFLKRRPTTVPCKRRMIKWATRLLINKKGKGKKESKIDRFTKEKGPNFGFCTCVKNKKAECLIMSD